MQAHIHKRTLLVVSDTAMIHDEGRILVFDPVLREMKLIQDMFDSIIWLGARTLHNKPSLKPINSPKIKAVVMPCVSYKGFRNIIHVLLAYPVFLYYILKYLPKATHVHTRGPAHPAWLMILISYLDNKRIYAHKYAGEWTDKNIPFTYRAQRSLVKRMRKPNLRVTISGKNNEEGPNVFDLENPCIYAHELAGMNTIGRQKDFGGDLTLLFVGNFMQSKGVLELMEALQSIALSNRYKHIYIVGGGRLRPQVEEEAGKITRLSVTITGDISREELNKLYAKAHMLVLPSISESFPKVVAEAAAFGCIPVTTSLSAIMKKIRHGENGYLMKDNHPDTIVRTLNEASGNDKLVHISTKAMEMSKLFTYERYKESMQRVYSIS